MNILTEIAVEGTNDTVVSEEVIVPGAGSTAATAAEVIVPGAGSTAAAVRARA